jgi:hypothetical protein
MKRDAQHTKERASPALRSALEELARDLRFVSEMDHPFTWVSTADPAPDQPLTPNGVSSAFGESAGAPSEERPLDRFFAGHIDEVDPSDPMANANVPRFQALKQGLRDSLPDVRVFCSGDAEKRCFLVGRTADGQIAGLETRIAET